MNLIPNAVISNFFVVVGILMTGRLLVGFIKELYLMVYRMRRKSLARRAVTNFEEGFVFVMVQHYLNHMPIEKLEDSSSNNFDVDEFESGMNEAIRIINSGKVWK